MTTITLNDGTDVSEKLTRRVTALLMRLEDQLSFKALGLAAQVAHDSKQTKVLFDIDSFTAYGQNWQQIIADEQPHLKLLQDAGLVKHEYKHNLPTAGGEYLPAHLYTMDKDVAAIVRNALGKPKDNVLEMEVQAPSAQINLNALRTVSSGRAAGGGMTP